MKHSLGHVPVAATLTKLFEVPKGHKIEVTHLRVNVGSVTNVNITLYWQFGTNAATKIYLAKDESYSTLDSPQFKGELIMQEGDSMWFNSQVGSLPTVICSFNLYTENKLHAFDT